ncbi:gamma-glutamyl:cysteine ligase YbdK (ATP-grasp superfamily) [Cryobacterium psychrotolerans]|nr:gamma-glutamyl:cysteine ligase YbdK (ATP-grasp superfamily) [Cryobacterium psychrotolerans]
MGVPSRDAGVRALNRLRIWLPTLMALSGNSPFWRGSSTGFDSWRAVIMRRWTTTGCPSHFNDAADYDRRIRRLVGVGATTDVATVAWYGRLSEVHPTLEVRVADAQLDVESRTLLAALTRGLVATALDEAGRDIPPLTVEPELLDAALWHAARDGIRGNLLNPATTELTPAREAITTMVRSIEGSLDDAGDQQRVAESLEHLWRKGTGAQQQERAFATKGRSGLSAFLETSFTS